MKKQLKFILPIAVCLIVGFGLYFLSLNKKEKETEYQKTLGNFTFKGEDIREIPLDLLFEESEEQKQLTREEFLILLARSATNDDIKTKYVDKDLLSYRTFLRKAENKEYLQFFVSRNVNNEIDLLSYTYGDPVHYNKALKMDEMYSFLFHTIATNTNSLQFKTFEHNKKYEFVNFRFTDDLYQLSNYRVLHDFIPEKLKGDQTVDIQNVLPVLKEINNEFISNQTTEDISLDVDSYDYRSSGYDSSKHQHYISDEMYYKDQHMLIHAIMNYQHTYGELPVSEVELPVLPQTLKERLEYVGLNKSDFKVVDLDLLHPEFLAEPFTTDQVIVHPTHAIFFVDGYHLESGEVFH